MGWTEERVELLKKLWMEGLSASQIAGVLGEGVTRNAVIGKVHRLKLSGRSKPASAAPRVRTTPRTPARRISTGASAAPSAPRPMGTGGSSAGMVKQRTMVSAPMQGATALKIAEEMEQEIEIAPQAEPFVPEANRISLLGLNEHTCKWPIGDPLSAGFYFCGQHSEDGKPYCEFHARRAYHQVDRKKR
ncbi:GcrA cell cycle regulator [Arsenicitalea aurantiaca]|uniref:GcrA cell cycle regulator n=1 Tax=Arsenicitalea aurantiaca TaxID=1783274 RepID=A0A433XBF6_9HYPH|nr:GcrA family cell cycle regulator [Arsenicitalea aurantiaca]RUT31328.1 GcrA cell cycle regulator [Arsenicitalea aurantiaca]